MAARIIVEASDVWEYFNEHKKELFTQSKMIADNQEYGVEIFLTEDDDLPLITVTMDSDECDSEAVVSARDCFDTVKKFYDGYLTNNVMDIVMGKDDELTASEELEVIDEREMEIDDAIYALLDTLVPNMFDIEDDPDGLYEDLKDLICEWLYTERGISVYRPMYLEDESGNDEFFKFPYPEMELDE